MGIERKTEKRKKGLNLEETSIHEKVESMKKRYQKLCGGSLGKITEQNVSQPKEKEELINGVVIFAEQKLEEMDEMDPKARRRIAVEVWQKIKQIEQFDLSLEQASRINNVISSDKFKSLNRSKIDGIDYCIYTYKLKMSAKILEAITRRIDNIHEMDELLELVALLKKQNITGNNSSLQAFEMKLNSKKAQLRQETFNLNNNISADIYRIINDIAHESFDFEVANQIINQEVEKRMQRKNKNRFGSLNEQQERRLIINEIRREIKSNTENCILSNPTAAIENLILLDKDNKEDSIAAVVRNLLGRRDYKLARQICDNYTGRDEMKNGGVKFKSTMQCLSKEIDAREVADRVLFYLNRENSAEDEEKFLKFLEDKINREGIKMVSVRLGKRQDGKYDITLEDIYCDKETSKEYANKQ